VARETKFLVSLNDDEAAILDERRGGVPKATYLRQMLHGPPQRAEVATRSEALHLLSLSARDGKVMAQVALPENSEKAESRRPRLGSQCRPLEGSTPAGSRTSSASNSR
jgi:hypothetical protein